jgi:hypothetical protein
MYLYVSVILDVKPVKGFGHVNMSIGAMKNVITKITKLSTSPLRISNGTRRSIIPNSIFVESCDQIVSSFWSHDFIILVT